MSYCMRFGRLLSCIAAVAMLATPMMAAEQASQQAKNKKVFDVTLTKQGTLVGQLLSAEGAPQPGMKVVATGKTQVVTSRTDARGVFQVPVATPGVYRVAMADRSVTVRAWKAELAPPATRDSLLCVANGQTVRGQGAGLPALLTNPIFIGLGVAAAVAIPIVVDEIDDDDDDLPSAS